MTSRNYPGPSSPPSGPYQGAPPKYINDFSKALANEVRILLAEVGKLRDERRALQYEIAELMSVKSKFGGSNDFSPDWRPSSAEPLPPPPAPPAVEDAPPPGPARPAWRTVHKRKEKVKQITAAPSSPAPAPPLEAPKPGIPAWSQWRPNPLYNPEPAQSPFPVSPPGRAGLFGPPSPPPK
ncbi:hypothetical protein EV122DRAFT_276024 [Schizophyllum commune]|uniref:uncharacterized protein n=1 Tax=Schizophyllum commune (strain H4-8 / FGSC 9210) TaxID=578458 RepID=UPI002160F71C|nr:uncharacterized protein SCHCODRAFT_02628032 [Schizophyllum commune H4-8]KAI4527632.1 hypothetical protein K525DRAFT_255714 [Schizophyllum commune Loenen D]KAI5891063.1 hypothetical protein SCHCODRAFT_02628032 [Schizophyllum commune H4-8]